MNHSLISIAIFALLSLTSASAQTEVTYPYNPDSDANEEIGVSDLTSMLAVFGGSFAPGSILVDGVALAEYLNDLQETISSLQDQVNALESQVIPGLSEHLSYVDSTNTFLLQGTNLQVTRGTASSGAGNLIVGMNGATDFAPNPTRTGTHNLVIGNGHSYTGHNGIVHGENGTLAAVNAAVIGGRKGRATATGALALGGHNNHSDALDAAIVGGGGNYIASTAAYSAILGGERDSLFQQVTCAVGGSDNKVGQDLTQDARWSASIAGNNNAVARRFSVIVAGTQNTTNGNGSSILSGQYNETTGHYCATVGGYQNVSAGNNAVVVAGQTNVANGPRSIILGGRSNTSQPGTDSGILGGRFNVVDGEDNIIIGGKGNTMENIINEEGQGVYNRWSVMLGGSNNHMPSDLEDFSLILGKSNRAYIQSADSTSHVQVGPPIE